MRDIPWGAICLPATSHPRYPSISFGEIIPWRLRHQPLLDTYDVDERYLPRAVMRELERSLLLDVALFQGDRESASAPFHGSPSIAPLRY